MAAPEAIDQGQDEQSSRTAHSMSESQGTGTAESSHESPASSAAEGDDLRGSPEIGDAACPDPTLMPASRTIVENDLRGSLDDLATPEIGDSACPDPTLMPASHTIVVPHAEPRQESGWRQNKSLQRCALGEDMDCVAQGGPGRAGLDSARFLSGTPLQPSERLAVSKVLPAVEAAISTLRDLGQILRQESLGMAGGEDLAAPLGHIEALVRLEMSKALKVDESAICCRSRDFFSLGGTMSSASSLLQALREREELVAPDGRRPELAVEDLKEGATVCQIARVIADRVAPLQLRSSLQSCDVRPSARARANLTAEPRMGPLKHRLEGPRLRPPRPNRRIPERTQEEDLETDSATSQTDPPATPRGTTSSSRSQSIVGPGQPRYTPSARFRVSDGNDGTRRRVRRQSLVVPLSSVFIGSLPSLRSLNRSFLLAIVESGMFQIVSGIIIVLSALCVGLESETQADGEQSDLFALLNLSFDCIFFSELLLRIAAHGRNFFSHADWRWNCLDTACVVISVTGDVVVMLDQELGEQARTLTIVRLVRILRIMRSMKSVREFQKMLYAFLSSMRTLLCSLLMLFLVMYLFAVMFCQGVAYHKFMAADADLNLQELDMYFGKISRAFLSLFMCITNGISWTLVYTPLSEVSLTYAVLFLVYLTTCLFGVMNVVTSVFVESAVMSAQHYKHLIIQEKARQREIAMGHMKQVFHQIDIDRSGEISADEMDAFLMDPGSRKYLEALDINAENAVLLFRLLDRDNSRCVDIDEFCEGCLRLQGDAKSFDIHVMMFQMQAFLSKWSDFTHFVESCFVDLAHAHGSPELFAQLLVDAGAAASSNGRESLFSRFSRVSAQSASNGGAA